MIAPWIILSPHLHYLPLSHVAIAKLAIHNFFNGYAQKSIAEKHKMIGWLGLAFVDTHKRNTPSELSHKRNTQARKEDLELYTTFSTLAGKLCWRGRSWVFHLNKSDICPSFIEDLTAKVSKYNWEKIPFKLEWEAFEPERRPLSWRGGYVITRYAELVEKNLISQKVSGRAVELEEIQDEDTSPSENTSEIPIEVEVEEHSLGDLKEPTNYKAAMLYPESNKWLDAMNKKSDMDGNVHTYKTRLVPKGFTQTYGVDYEETFSPIADIRAIMILIAIAAFYDYEIWQMDVKTAFLNGYLDEDIYMV
ncbi:retrotransposon protein, putative, ty1-copia subclass [Tanacetum coccineum]